MQVRPAMLAHVALVVLLIAKDIEVCVFIALQCWLNKSYILSSMLQLFNLVTT